MKKSTPDATTLLATHQEAVKNIMRRHGIRGLIAFGSRARGDAQPESDFDLAIEMRPGAKPLALLAAEADLEEELGLTVHLVELPKPALDKILQQEGVRFCG